MSYGKITNKQREILEFIKDEILKRGYPPAVREICEAVNLKSTSSVHSHLETLEKNGYIRRDPTKPRAIEIVDDSFQQVRTEMTSIPIIGTVAAGQPILAEQNIEGYFPMPVDMVPNAETFALKVKGDSMINVGIFNGDRVFVERCQTARNGDTDIKDVYEVRGDVDLVTGKVEFFGDITIKGNVGSGVTIRASRNVFIEGVVESAFIYAGGDITIKKGVTGNDKAVIKAKGNVYSDFIEYANVEANQNVRANYIMNSNVYAAGKVIVEGKNGSILGGNVRGLLGVNAGTIGNDKSVKTTVASGFSAAEYESYVQCHTKENELKDTLSNTVEQMTQILKNKRLGNDKDSDESDKLIEILNAKKDWRLSSKYH